jgi:hypothetical protein
MNLPYEDLSFDPNRNYPSSCDFDIRHNILHQANNDCKVYVFSDSPVGVDENYLPEKIATNMRMVKDNPALYQENNGLQIAILRLNGFGIICILSCAACAMLFGLPQ